MKAETWRLAFDLFRRAVALEGDQRVRLLDTRCAGRPELRREVERMLAADAADGVLDHAVFPRLSVGTQAVGSRPPVGPPERIGAYRIVREVASGGMGTVYEAEQDRPRRTVALKTLRRHLLSEGALRRFRLEAEVLGSLQHPGIAQVFESGTFGRDDTPFLAMEYVKGGHDLLSWARERGLDRDERIELFLSVCDAVHHAHQRGVVHRDLKPGNVLVDPSGRPKVIDFGLARITEPDRQRVSLVETDAGRALGTLPYMSPEQLDPSSGAADVLSDVWALGVVLFELLSGELPHDPSGEGLARMVANLRDGEPRKLREVAPRSPRELEWICARALETERGRRYASVHELAADLRRFLRHEPVLAGPPSAIYRLRKLGRRHRFGFAAAGAVLLVALGGLLTTWTNALRAQRHLRERNVQLEVANEANGFLTRVLSALRPERGSDREVTLKDFVDEAAAELEASPPALPAVEAQVRSTLGTTYESLGLHAEAEAQYEACRGLARAAWGELAPRTLEVEVRRLNNLFSLGPLERAHQETAAMAARWTEALGPDDLSTLHARRLEGACLWKSVRHEEAEALLRDVVARLPPAGTEDELAFAAYTSLAQVLVDLRRVDQALEVYDELADLAGGEPVGAYEEWILFRSNLATLKLHAGRVEEGLAELRDVVTELRRVYGPTHPWVLPQIAELARLLVIRGEGREETEALLEELIAASREIRGGEVFDQVMALLRGADAFNRLERYAEAEELARAAVEANERLSVTGTLESIRAWLLLGTALTRQEELDEAEEALYEGLGRAVEKLSETDPLVQEFERELDGIDQRRG